MWSLLGHDPPTGVIVVTQGTGIEDFPLFCVCILGIEYNSRDGGSFTGGLWLCYKTIIQLLDGRILFINLKVEIPQPSLIFY